ncbi:MAG: hypothetical protein Q4E06_13205 [Lautropia sp.]|nr:hypothetical protein [Lautropia sp.]
MIQWPGWLSSLVDWLRQPLRAGHVDTLNQTDFWHGLLMALGGGVLVPVAVLAARYWKIVPGQDWPRVVNHRAWHWVHGLCGGGAVLCLLVGCYLAFHGMSLHQHLAHPHAWAGWTVVAMLVLLLVNIAARGSIGGPGRRQARTLVHLHDVPGDHYDMTARRRVFEFLHSLLGYGLVVMVMLTIGSGFWFVNVPRGLAMLVAAWWLLLLGLAWRWERQGRAVDGYQARWGPGMGHPGNRIPVVGWRRKRYTEDEYRRLSWGGRLLRRRLHRQGRRPSPAAGSSGSS